ncbi:MAG TPA: ATP-binding protein [Bryobacteraceae bacterium]|nr:ATP-binding protein [Bryobacteraceae bacterium]
MTGIRAQLSDALLVILTVAAVVCGGISYQQQRLYLLPEDGATWMDFSDRRLETGKGEVNRVVAVHLEKHGAAEVAGIRKGDVLSRIGTTVNPSGMEITTASDVARVLQRIGAWSKAEYTLLRDGVELKATVIVADANRDKALYGQYAVGLAWLSIGLFVWFRRRRAPNSSHFYLLCLSSFVLHTFHYTGKLNAFDTAIYFGNVAAGLLAPALFLHFCLTFPERRKNWGRAQLLSVYLPAISLIVLQVGVAAGFIRTALPLFEMRWLLDRAWLLLFTGSFLAGGAILHLSSLKADDPITRQQLKWLRNGALAGVLPFAILYAGPYIAGLIPAPAMRLSVLVLALIPLSWAYAILRYRLMDVDIIFQQGYVYLLATLSVLGIVSLLVFALSRGGPGGRTEEVSPTSVVLLVLVGMFVFEPLRNWIQQQLDRYVFYKDRYDYRVTLVSFARELSSEMDLDHTLASVGERLIRTLQIEQVAFFLVRDNAPGFQLHAALDREGRKRAPRPQSLDLSFLDNVTGQPYLFFERTRHAFDVVTRELPAQVRTTIAELDLTYYIPCQFRGATLAWMGVSRSVKGDFLSSDDIDLLATLSNYIAMAVENARLYRSLAAKAEQYERLKEFSENIVESINVGILAADLDDRVESWNSRMEAMTGIERQTALGHTLASVLPESLAVHLEKTRGDKRVHQLYKFPLDPSAISGESNSNGNGHSAPATVNVAIAPLVTKDGQHIGRLVIFDDVTERENLERRLVQADKLSSIGLLAAGVAHEVNTPLAVISTYAQMLAKQVHGDEPKTRLLEKIAKSTFRASEIVNSLLNFSRTSTTEFEDIELNRIIRETAALVEHQMEKAGIRVSLELADDLPLIRGNAGKLQQVFLNLLLNSRDAMDGGGALAIRTSATGAGVRAVVSDTGPGIPRDLLNRIFDPFFTTKASRKGTGLGLSISYGIVEEHGGQIVADSRPGEGAVFRLEFPAARKTVNA